MNNNKNEDLIMMALEDKDIDLVKSLIDIRVPFDSLKMLRYLINNEITGEVSLSLFKSILNSMSSVPLSGVLASMHVPPDGLLYLAMSKKQKPYIDCLIAIKKRADIEINSFD